ncbi:Prenyltransferase and squalene oxidase repeat protein [Streptomyces sp. ADI96-02]|uniref:prenyltransferase/squalene oxidase repeat-containing protein n=1 Tax=Streptomyces sp. ADI96-02 TaxID=1522760 RepID=UPI000F552DCC|nr:prenyltransferase/squalene oxidase repeat-containing protein [Streptomyces sp. ADI96-02]RPK68232.1 Prenyltransferase and squalene oxidase repeat protein [Streptomyces sp. ADI96-02]
MGTEQRARRGAGAGRRLLSLLTASLVTLGAAAVLLTAAPPVEADPVERCTRTTGAIVAVDFGPWGGPVVRGCDTTPTTGYELLHTGGFTTEGTGHDGPAFICRIGSGGFAEGGKYPTPAEEDCVLTPRATAYWSYWTASPGRRKWTYSPLGAVSRTLKPGDVDAWVYGGTDIGGTKGRPTFTPDDVRAEGGDPPDPSDPAAPNVPAGSVDLPAATRWLADRLTNGQRVVDEGATEPNYPATTEVAYALASFDREDPTARRIARFLARPEHTEAYAYRSGKDEAPDATAAARLALLAEATDGDPRSFGGHDLLGDLLANVCRSGSDAPQPVPGCATEGDFRTTGQTEGQALAVIALLSGGVTPPAYSVQRLAQLQCDDGGFPSFLLLDGQVCESEPGTTALVALALQQAGGHTSVVTRARSSLKKSQFPTGAWPAASYSTPGSAHATGWVAQTLRALGDRGHADAGVSWLSRQQLPGGGFAFEEGTLDPLLYATTTAVMAGAKSDLVLLTTEEPEPPTTPPTDPPTTTPPTGPPAGEGPDLKKGSAYLASRLAQGRYYESSPRFADFGMTIDGAYALAATGHDNATLRNIVDFLDEGGEDGTGRDLDAWTRIGTKHAGGGFIGKAAVLAEAVGRDPRDFGGQDLIAALARGVCPAATPADPRKCAAKGNYAYANSVFSQSLGVIAQIRAGESAAATEPITYLKSLQDPSTGSWPSLTGEKSDPDVDSTAMAAMTVDLLPDPASQAAVDKALAWLAAQQLPDGGFPGASGNSVNSAALAIQGLSLDSAKYRGHLAKARKFLASQQNKDGGFNVVKGGQPGSDVRASAQAVGGATGISFGVLTRDLSGTSPEPIPSPSAKPGGPPSAPTIITTGEDRGGTGSPGGPAGGTGGSLAATGARVAALAAAAAALVLGGWGAIRTARRRRDTTGGQA